MNLPNLETAFTLTWHSSLRACVLIVAVLVIQALAGQRLPARFRYALSLLVLLRLIVLLTPASGWSVFNLTRQVQPAPAAAAPILPFPATPAMAVALPPSNPPPAALNRPSRLSWGRLGAAFWLCGGAGCLLAVFWRHRTFARWVAQLPAPGDARLLELVEQCKIEAGIRRGVRIASAPRENSAAVFGFFRPCLLLPEGMLDSLERREARLVVLHELLHIRRGDVLVNWISVLTLALHWFNPLAWVAMRRLRADQELACDAAVLNLIEPSERGAYGRTLLKLLHDFPAARMAAGLVPLITSRHNIKRRIIMITEFRRTGPLARALFAVLLVALGGLTFTRAADSTPAGTNTGPPTAADTTPLPDSSAATPTPKARLDYGAEYVKQSTLLEQLREMAVENHPRFIQALSATVSDPILNSLLEQELSQETRLAGFKTTLGPNATQTREQDALINNLKKKIDQRADGLIAGMSLQTSALKAAANDGLRRAAAAADNNTLSKKLADLAHQQILAQAEYLNYSNILFTLDALPSKDLGGALNTAFAHQLDPELIDLNARLQQAEAKMVEAKNSFGREMPAYRTAGQQLENAQSAYQKKIDDMMTGIRTRVDQDKKLLQFIEQEMQKIEKSHLDAPQY
jgi:beta-lactamase regulating signal transducer with metallopeptidase domain